MLLVTDKSGQLANRLFLFGHLIGFALEHSSTILYPTFDEYAPYFQATRKDILCRFPPVFPVVPATTRTRRKLLDIMWRVQTQIVRRRLFSASLYRISLTWDEACCMSRPEFVALASSKNLILNGWRFRDHDNFNKHAGFIKKHFEPTTLIKHSVTRLIADCRRESSLLIGVHIRRGDYREFRGGLYYREDSEYAEAMTRLQQMHSSKTIIFLLCSNEPIAANAFPGFHWRLGTNHLVEDLYALAECDYLIGPPSTFSQWASFYGQVPLYQMRKSKELVSLNQFDVADSHCDLPEDIAACSNIVLN